jgi:hypothetical protein
MKRKIYRAVEFDALNMRTARDIKCRGPVLNLGDAPQLWDVRATVIVRGEDGDTHHTFQFRPSERVPLAALNRLVADELTAADYDRGNVVAIPVKAVIR